MASFKPAMDDGEIVLTLLISLASLLLSSSATSVFRLQPEKLLCFKDSHVEIGLMWLFQDPLSILRFITLMTTGKSLYRSTLIRVEKPGDVEFWRHPL